MKTFADYKILADSSFYICFLDDINRHDCLGKIVIEFDFILPPIVNSEIQKSKNYSVIKNCKDIVPFSLYYDVSSILKPFFGSQEIKKGEHEVIGYAYFLNENSDKFYFILDEDGPRKFVERYFPTLTPLMKGTAKFVGMCACEFYIMSKQEVREVLTLIENSPFRITKNILDKVRLYLEGC